MFRTVYDDTDDAAAAAKEAAAAATAAAADDKKIHLTQDELNAMMADNRKKLTQQNTEALTQLEKLRDEVKMSTEQKSELELKIESLQESFMSKDELAKKTASKQAKEHQKMVDGLTTERDNWRGRYSAATNTRAIQDAAIEGKAKVPAQIVEMLGQHTHLIEGVDESGQPNGKYVPTVKFNDTDDDGKAIVLDLSPLEAIKRMKELTNLYGNLFEGTATGGVGGEAGATGGDSSQPKLDDVKNDPEKYIEWRKKNKETLDVNSLRR